jgi:hypothetical protein
MPSPAQILETLSMIANDQKTLALVWHIILAATILMVVLGWRPARKFGAAALAAPLLSVSVQAWIYGNPFNGVVFLIFAAALAAMGMRLPAKPVEPPQAWARIIGLLMIAFGWIYPHFLAGGPWWRYLYQAPVGLIPCPTLSAVIGLALLARGFSARGWSIVLGVLGLFYSLFGALRLGVTIDLALLAGSLALLWLARCLKPVPKSVA